MNHHMNVADLRFFLIFLAMSVGSHASAQGVVSDFFNTRKPYGQTTMTCLMVNDFYAVHFTAIQEIKQEGKKAPFVKYCEEIPATGKTYLTIDLLDRDSRTVPVGLKVVEESIGDGSHEIIKTLTELPAKIYRNGTADTSVMIDKPGHYALIATFGDAAISEDDKLRIPFTVGLPAKFNYTALFGKFVGALLVALFLAMGIIGYRTYRSGKNRRTVAGGNADGAKIG